MNKFKIGDYVVRKESYQDKNWKATFEDRRKSPFKVVKIKKDRIYLEGNPYSWHHFRFNLSKSPKKKIG